MAHQFIFSNVTMIKAKNSSDFKEYTQCLKLYWAHDLLKSLGQLTGYLASNPEHSYRYNLYHLWVQLLGELGDQRGLEELEQHLASNWENCAEDEVSVWMSLLGLCQLEMTAPKIALPPQGENMRHMASQHEVLFSYLSNYGKTSGALNLLENCKNRVDDYFYLVSLARYFYLNSRFQDLLIIYNYSNTLFEGSPLEIWFKLHIAYEGKNYENASHYASQLTHRYPKNPDYWFYRATIAENLGRDNESQSAFEQAFNHLSPSNYNEKRLMNLTVLQNLQNKKHKNENVKSLKNYCWLALLDNDQSFKLMAPEISSGAKWELALGKKAQKGDLCFVARTVQDSQDIKILGVFESTAQPIWHPTLGFLSEVKLKTKLVPGINVEMRDIDQTNKMSLTTSKRKKLFELEGSAIDSLIHLLQNHENLELVGQLSPIEHKLENIKLSS